MQDSQATFHSANGRRLVLIVEDEAVNREILGTILGNDFDVIFAEDGEEALCSIQENKELLSLIVLDLIMPNMPGQEVLRRIKENPEYQTLSRNLIRSRVLCWRGHIVPLSCLRADTLSSPRSAIR